MTLNYWVIKLSKSGYIFVVHPVCQIWIKYKANICCLIESLTCIVFGTWVTYFFRSASHKLYYLKKLENKPKPFTNFRILNLNSFQSYWLNIAGKSFVAVEVRNRRNLSIFSTVKMMHMYCTDLKNISMQYACSLFEDDFKPNTFN